MAIRTAVVPVSEILPLRWEVLRPGMPREAAVFPEDAQAEAFHIAAYDAGGGLPPGSVDGGGTRGGGAGGAVLGCGSFFPEPFPEPFSAPFPDTAPAGTAYRIRGMASAAGVRGQGYGAAVLQAGTREAVARGARLMWCNGRTEARGFYERHGYEVSGDEFVIEGVGPHHVFVRKLG